MSSIVDGELLLTRDQIVTSTQASKNFGEVRRRARVRPQFVSGRSGIDTVVVSYESYEAMCLELERRREEDLLRAAAERLACAPERTSLQDAMGEEAYVRLLSTDPDSIPDEDLFE